MICYSNNNHSCKPPSNVIVEKSEFIKNDEHCPGSHIVEKLNNFVRRSRKKHKTAEADIFELNEEKLRDAL